MRTGVKIIYTEDKCEDNIYTENKREDRILYIQDKYEDNIMRI